MLEYIIVETCKSHRLQLLINPNEKTCIVSAAQQYLVKSKDSKKLNVIEMGVILTKE